LGSMEVSSPIPSWLRATKRDRSIPTVISSNSFGSRKRGRRT
jgi:hypothetical protein